MKINSAFTMTIIVIIAMAILLILNLVSTFWNTDALTRIGRNDVRGIAVSHNKKLYTLNFEQQNEVVDLLNRTVNVSHLTAEEEISSDKEEFGFDHLVIYRFNAPDLIITPKKMGEGNIYFFVPEWNATGLVMDVSQGRFKTLISQTYD